MAVTIQLRHGTAAEWSAANPILAEGEMGVVTDLQTYKIGNGSTPWNSLGTYQLSPELLRVVLSGTTDPSSVDAGKLAFYAKPVAGRMLPKIKGPSGLDSSLQPALFSNSIILLSPSTTTTISAIGTPVTTQTGTASTPAIASGNGMRQSTRRFTITSASTAGSISMQRTTLFQCFRGDQPGLGGFFFNLRFAVPSVVPGSHFQCGLFGATSLSAATTPSSQVNWIGMGWDAGDTNMSIYRNGSSGTATKIDLGVNFPAGSNEAVYELTLFSAPNGTEIGWRAQRLDTADSAEGIMTDNLPANSVLLAYQAKFNNGTATTSVVYEMLRMYIETDV